jgi:DNA-binding GntR family transcriptional regulator
MVVAEMTPERLVLMFEALAELEASCARYAALRMDEDERHYLVEVHDLAAQAAEARDADHYARLNVEFHAVILRGCRNTFLSEPAFTLRTRALAFRRAQFHNRIERVEHSFTEHRQVLDAILRRDGDSAFAAMRQHLAAAQDASAQILRTRGDSP